MKKLIIANWKMNPASGAEALRLATSVWKRAKKFRKVDLVFAPPFVFLPILKKFKLSAQDVFWENKGAYTGEISVKELKSLGVHYAIIGHSERRALGETNEVVNKKLKAALGAGLRAVLCVGEPEKKREIAFPPIVREELRSAISGIKKALFKNLVIAYEPIWAIGGGRADSPKDVYEMSLLIRRELLRMLGKKISARIPVLYGGSVDDKNAEIFVKEASLDGLLVGGASLNPKKFVRIVEKVALL